VNSTTQFFTIILIVLALALQLTLTQFILRRRRRAHEDPAFRVIPAYQAVSTMVGAAIEEDQPLHFSLGSAGIGANSTLLALAGAEFFYQVVRETATGDVAPLLTVSDPSAIPLGQDTLRRAYLSRGRLDHYRPASVRWYPSGPRGLAFAGALTATMGDSHVSGNILVGSFGPELALVLEAAARRGHPSIASSDQLAGQAVAYVMADQPLIGEEVFTAGAYLGEDANQVSSLITQDVLRWLIILGILVPTVIAVISKLRGGS
jgi:uncharacterized protein DUF6754